MKQRKLPRVTHKPLTIAISYGIATSVFANCQLGYYSPTNDTNCLPAPVGYYVDTTTAITPTPAPVGKYIDVTGATSVTVAKTTLAGFYSTGGQSAPTPAQLGHYVPAPGLGVQTNAPKGGYVNRIAASTFTLARKGYYVDSVGATAETIAPIGSYVDHEGATAQQVALAGYYVPDIGATTAIRAPLGYYVSSPGASAPTPAPIGSYVDQMGAINPQPAPVGSYVDHPAATTFIQADVGFYVPVSGASAQIPASPGSYVDEIGQGMSKPAEPGHYVDTVAATIAAETNFGFYANVPGLTAGIAAPAGYYAAAKGLIIPTVTPPGFFTSQSGSTQANACPPNTASYGAAPECRRINALATAGMGPAFAFVDPASGHFSLYSGIIAKAHNYLWLDIANQSSDLGYPMSFSMNDALNQLKLTQLTLLGFDAASAIENTSPLSAPGFPDGAVLYEGDILGGLLDIQPTYPGYFESTFEISTDQRAPVYDPQNPLIVGDSFSGKVSGEADGVDVYTRWHAFQEQAPVSSTARYRLLVANRGNQTVTGIDVNATVGAGLNACVWSVQSQSSMDVVTTLTSTMSNPLSDTVNLPATSWIEYQVAQCVVQGASTLSATVDIPTGDTDSTNNNDTVALSTSTPNSGDPLLLSVMGPSFVGQGQSASWTITVSDMQIGGIGGIGWLEIDAPVELAHPHWSCVRVNGVGGSCPTSLPADDTPIFRLPINVPIGGSLVFTLSGLGTQYEGKSVRVTAELSQVNGSVNYSSDSSIVTTALFANGFD